MNEKKGQDRTGIKSQKGYISPICGEAPTEAMYMKICGVGDLLDVITYAKFQNEIFRGYSFTGGRIFHFPIDFEWALQQCSATALPVIRKQVNFNGSCAQPDVIALISIDAQAAFNNSRSFHFNHCSDRHIRLYL